MRTYLASVWRHLFRLAVSGVHLSAARRAHGLPLTLGQFVHLEQTGVAFAEYFSPALGLASGVRPNLI
jgi:hypothetical protein